MAIVQISRITNRKGLTENLPQLAGAELGWAVDSRRLFIGNGTLESGAPVIGNTEVLTEFSDIPALSTYIYKDLVVGYEPQTGVAPSEPVVRTVQERLDDIATVRAFGAVGDGVTDDTVAINRALLQLFCVQANTSVRRALYFPAGTYRLTESINIPSYAKIIGEGADSTIFLLDSAGTGNYVARCADSLGQTGANIGNNGATPPRNIEISGVTFKTDAVTDAFLVEDATQCYFDSCNFQGPLSEQNIIDNGFTDDIAGVRFASTVALVCNQITFDKCAFLGLTDGVNTSEQIESVTVSNSRFERLYRGIALGTESVVGTGPTGFRAIHNMFDRVYSNGIVFDNVELNISAYNIFYDVANEFTSSPTAPVVLLGNDNNVSMSDMFVRTDFDAEIEPRVKIVGAPTLTSTQVQLGRFTRQSGKTFSLLNNQSVLQTVFSLNTLDVKAVSVNYTITRGSAVRHGVITIITQDSGDSALTLSYTDDFTENLPTGVTLSAQQLTSTSMALQYLTDNGSAGTLTYSIMHLA